MGSKTHGSPILLQKWVIVELIMLLCLEIKDEK
jgi:hypothetical protein